MIQILLQTQVTQSIVCATVDSQCLEYLGYITLPNIRPDRLETISKICHVTLYFHEFFFRFPSAMLDS